MKTDNWISIEDAFPPLGLPVLVSDSSLGRDQASAAPVAARLVESWQRTEAEGLPVCVWADEEGMDELTFDPTHWRPVQAHPQIPGVLS